MVSFNVELLFTNIPLNATVQAALQKFENDPSLADRTTLMPAQIADLLTFIPDPHTSSITYRFTSKRQCHHGESGFRCYC